MLGNPPFIVRKRRNRKGQATPAAPPVVPLPLSGVDSPGLIEEDLQMWLIFDTTEADPLSSVSGADPGKWSARFDGVRYVGSELTNVTFAWLYLRLTPTGADAGDNELNYEADPSDVFDTLGRQLTAFEGMPI